MGAFDNIKDKAADMLNSDKGEEVSDNVLDKAADMIDDKTGGKFSDKIEAGRDAADSKIGNE